MFSNGWLPCERCDVFWLSVRSTADRRSAREPKNVAYRIVTLGIVCMNTYVHGFLSFILEELELSIIKSD